jgi:hypothetical protein
MRLTIVILPALLATGATAEPLSSRLASLIPSDALFVAGIDIARYQHAQLNSFYPMTLEGMPCGEGSAWIENVRQLVVAEGAPGSGMNRLTILIGTATSPSQSGESDGADAAGNGSFALLDAATVVCGHPQMVREALSRWHSAGGQSGELADKVKRMSETYDNWFIKVRPFEISEDSRGPVKILKYRADFAGAVKEVLGGVRVGGINEVRVEVVTEAPEDAAALAALGRWLPGLVQMKAPYSNESALADLAENLTVMPAGNTVSLSFTLDDSKLEDLARARHVGREE